LWGYVADFVAIENGQGKFGELDFEEGCGDESVDKTQAEFEGFVGFIGDEVVAVIGFIESVRDEVEHFNVLVFRESWGAGRVCDVWGGVRPNEEVVFALSEFALFVKEVDDGGS
jgi:hypothetical protein